MNESVLDGLSGGSVWSGLSAPIPSMAIEWRQDGKPMLKDGKSVARFVAYISANTVRERLDSVVPGEWNLTLTPLPALLSDSGGEPVFSFKSCLQVLGVTREDVGTGRSYKQAATDAFKRAAVRFGIAHELYAYSPKWVEVGSAKKKVDENGLGRNSFSVIPSTPSQTAASSPLPNEACPKCGGPMTNQRETKRNPRAPDFRCRNRSCDGVIWPANSNEAAASLRPSKPTSTHQAPAAGADL